MSVCSSDQAAEIEVNGHFLGLNHSLVLLYKCSIQEQGIVLVCSCGFMYVFNACVMSVQQEIVNRLECSNALHLPACPFTGKYAKLILSETPGMFYNMFCTNNDIL